MLYIIVDFFYYCHTMLRACLGGPPSEQPNDQSPRLKVFLFTVLFTSNILWSGYRASLTSKLVQRELKMPFTTLDEFLDSDYRHHFTCSTETEYQLTGT